MSEAQTVTPAASSTFTTDDIVARAGRSFRERFGRAPRWLAAAPGRVNLIGEHTDYNGGHVLPMAIERSTVIAADLATGEDIRLVASDLHEEAVFPIAGEIAPGEPCWANYIKGVMAGYRASGADLPPLDALVTSDVPLGGGLSSSAALEVATATLMEALPTEHRTPNTEHLERLDTRPLQLKDKALLCQHAEHAFAGVPCGIMDQFISIGGRRDHLMLLDCRTLGYELIPLAVPGPIVLIINSQVKHALTGGEYAQRRRQCAAAAAALGVSLLCEASLEQLEQRRATLEPTVYRRARHVLSEDQRTLAVAKAIPEREWSTVGAAMAASHASLRDDFEVSCVELDLLVDLAQSIGPSGGVIGSRMTGGGFGGCTVSLVAPEKATEIAERIAAAYQRQTGIKPSWFTTRPAAGSHLSAVSTESS